MYVCNPVLKALNIYSALIPFFSLFSGLGQNWAKCDIFFQSYLYQFYLVILAIIVLIDKAFKLFKLVLVVYFTPCWQW